MAQGSPPRRPPAGPGGPGTGRHGYPEQPGTPAEPGRSGYPAGHGPPGTVGRHGYQEETDSGGYAAEGGYPGDRGYPGDGAYAEGRGYSHGRGYPDEREYAGGRGYADEREYADHRGEPAPRRHPDEGRRPARAEPAPRPRQHPSAFDDDDDVMPWTGPGIYPVGPGRRQRRPPREPSGEELLQEADSDGHPSAASAGQRTGSGRGGRAAAARARKSRRRLILGGVGIVIVAVIVLGVLGKLPFQGSPAKSGGNGLVTSFQPGEFRRVPNTCSMVSAATLSQYLPGKVAMVSQSPGGPAQSECTWTLDGRPNFRVLTVTAQAYAPSLLSSGDGSATFGAIDAYNQQLQALRDPPPSSKQPKALLGKAVGLGSSAFTAFQEFHLGNVVNDEVTVVARDRNAVIVVKMQGQESGGGFGPVPEATLRAGALAAAHEALTALR